MPLLLLVLGSKRTLWVLSEDATTPCLGRVGINNKFCVKACLEEKSHCGVNRHASKFDVVPDTAYIRSTNNQVMSSPMLDLTHLFRVQRVRLLAASMSAADWEICFHRIQQGDLPDWLTEELEEEVFVRKDDSHSMQLLSPVATKEKHGIFKIVPTFSFESTSSDEDKLDEDMDNLESTEGQVKKLKDKLLVLKGKLARPFFDIDASYNVLTSDLIKIHEKVKSVAGSIGTIRSSETIGHWIDTIAMKIKALEDSKNSTVAKIVSLGSNQNALKDELNHTMEEVAEVQAWIQQSQSWMNVIDQTLEVFKKRFSVIRPFLNHASTSPDGDYPGDLSAEALNRRLLDMQEKIKILENRVVGSGVQLGSCVFQSFEDLYKWVQVKVPKGRFGLFVDGHSFLEFFTLSGHIDTKAGAAAFRHSLKAGFTTYIEAQLAISFKNLFPAVFGKGGSSTLDDSECLPAISNGNKWNNGSTGLHHQLLRNMNDVSYQIDSTIKKVLHDHLEARQLAIDCVTASKRFAIDLITFMSQEYSTWQQRGFAKKAAWQIACQIMRRIFEDMQSARISACNIQDL